MDKRMLKALVISIPIVTSVLIAFMYLIFLAFLASDRLYMTFTIGGLIVTVMFLLFGVPTHLVLRRPGRQQLYYYVVAGTVACSACGIYLGFYDCSA
jgi:hypothetical protein